MGAATKTAASDNDDMIDELTAVKHLVQKLGAAAQVRKIVGLFE